MTIFFFEELPQVQPYYILGVRAQLPIFSVVFLVM